ncbi:xanthine dehydrogenase family protein molybdopterin-binding subunit [Deltaproteobacteria bacterium OttesenSCG-928-M10]|nr:xanthine dehydrogenase family protein molybdopterin-binding subunit [Deltaproteobacteria bacterium OttesenSCG-928-M10]
MADRGDDKKNKGVIGQGVRQKDGRPRVTGEAKYYADYNFPNLLHTYILRSPHPKAAVKSIDVSAAEKHRGVHLVMTHQNYPAIFRPVKYYVGDLTAAVVAESLEMAAEAAELIRIEYETGPFVMDMARAMDPEAPEVFDGEANLRPWPHHARLSDRDPDTGLHQTKTPHEVNEFGDLEKGFAEADVIVEQRDIYYAFCKSPAMETRGCTMDFDGSKLQVHTHSQGLHDEKMRLAQALEIPASMINYVSPFTGSSFGGKTPVVLDINNPSHYLKIAGLACLKLKRPVRCVYSREEEMLCAWSRGSLSHVKMGFKKDGTLTTMELDHTHEIGAGGDIYPAKNAMLATGAVLYSRNCRNNRGRIKNVCTNRFTCVGWQGYGAPEGTYAVETTMDIAAEELGLDPVEIRRLNCMRTGDVDNGWDPLSYISGYISQSGIRRCLEVGAEKVGWKERWRHPSEKTGRIRSGLGVAIFAMGAGRPGPGNSSEAMVKIFPDGSAALVSSIADAGQGQHTVQCQIAADALGLPYRKVGLVCRDTDSTPFSTLVANSSGTWIQGWATYEAALDAKRQLLALAAPLLNRPADELEMGDGFVFEKARPDNRKTVAEIFGPIGHYGGRHEIIGFYVNSSPHPNCLKDGDPGRLYIPKEKGAQFISLDVDTATGLVDNVVITLAQNVGRALNIKVVEGQLSTSRHGYDNALLANDCLADKRRGWLLTPNLIDYKHSTILDSVVDPQVVEIPGDPSHPFGATACGEGGACASMAAFANALYNAIGVRLKRSPFTPEAILTALGKVKRRA